MPHPDERRYRGLGFTPPAPDPGPARFDADFSADFSADFRADLGVEVRDQKRPGSAGERLPEPESRI